MPLASSGHESLSSSSVEVLVAIARGGARTLGRQIEDQLREKIRANILRPGAGLPSTRDLALQLGVSRPIVVNAYAQLAAEGYLVMRQGARPHVAEGTKTRRLPATVTPVISTEPLYDFRPGVPDLSAFPRGAWLRSLKEALRTMTDAELGYTDPRGTDVLRVALSDYLGRVRGVVSDPARVIVTSGWAQGRTLLCRALAAAGAKRLAVEDPCYAEAYEPIADTGLKLVPIPVDGGGISVEALDRANPDAVVVTPAHQYPSGVVLSGDRRAALVSWLRKRDAIAIEDDYDAEYRYDRAPVGALQALDPDRIAYAGTASKTLAPALRLGWLVVPPRLLKRVSYQQELVDFGGPRIEQHAFADFLVRGELDRHLRRMRARYRARRDALVDAIARELPEAEVGGIAAGLHVAVSLPEGYDETRIRDAALKRGVGLGVMSAYQIAARGGPPTLIMGYAQCSEATVREGVRELAKAVRGAGYAEPTPRPTGSRS